MLLQPADFYSYSRATGTKPPENDRERAAMAPDVIDFKRSQLKAPSPDSDEGRDLGLVALGAGILGSIIGGRQIARRTAQTKEVARKIQDLPNAPIFDPGPETKKAARRATQRNNQTLVKDLNEVKPSKIVESPTMVEKQQVDNTATSAQQVKSRGVTEQVNRDVQSVREGKTNELKAEAIIKARQNSDFANFSQDVVKLKENLATQKAAIQRLEEEIFETGPFSEGRLEAIAKRNEQTPDMTAFALTGRASELGLSRKRLKELGLKPTDELFGNLSQREADRRISAAADPAVNPEQVKKLMNPNYPSKKLMEEGLLDLTPEPINPDLELTAGGSQAFNLNRQRRARPQAASLDAIDDAYDAELAKIGMEQNMAGKTGIYAARNPTRQAAEEQFAKSWDALSRAGFVLPREETIDGKTYKYADLKFMRVNKFNADPVDVENYRQSGRRLRKLAEQYNLDVIPESELVITNPQTLQEVRTVKERSRKSGTSILTDEVQYDDLGQVGEGKDRLERQVRKENFTGESRAVRPRGGVLYDESGERQFVKSEVSYPGSTADLTGGYKTGEPIKYYRFGGEPIEQAVNVKGKYIGTYLIPNVVSKGATTQLKTGAPIGRTTNTTLSQLPLETYDPSTNVLNIQPYSVTTRKKVKTSLSQKTGMPKGEDFIVDDFIYGELVERKKIKDAKTGAVIEKLVPTSVRLDTMQDLAYRARAGLEDIDLSDPEKRKTYYSKIADRMYAMAKNPVKLTEKQIKSGMVAGIGKDLPVLKDFRTQGQFIKNLLTVEGESEAFGRRAQGNLVSSSTDRDRYIYNEAKPDKVKIPGYRIPKGLGGVTDQEIEAGQIRVNIGGSQRALGAQKLRQSLTNLKNTTGKTPTRSELFKLAIPIAREYNTDVNALLRSMRRG